MSFCVFIFAKSTAKLGKTKVAKPQVVDLKTMSLVCPILAQLRFSAKFPVDQR